MKIDYDTAASAYARFRQANPRILERLIQIGRIDERSRILEVGSGSGNYAIALTELTGCKCHGLEKSEGMLAKARERTDAVAWAQGDAQALPYPDKMFDFLFCVDVMHHIPKPDRFLDEAFRVLQADGCLCIVTDSEWTIRNRTPLSLYFPATVEEELKRYLPLDRLKELIVDSGFSYVEDELVELPYDLETADPFREKAFSCLHLISESAFQEGLAALSSALSNGPLPCIARSALLRATKKKGGKSLRQTRFTRR